MWTYTVLEIYQLTGAEHYNLLPWPTEGTPADWIEQGSVGYCQGQIEDLVVSIPLWKLLWWKVKAIFYH